MSERSKAFQVLITTIDTVTSEYGHAGKIIAAPAIDVRVHHVFFRPGIGKDLWPFQNPAAAEVLRVRELYNLVAKRPVDQVFGGITTGVSVLAVQSLGTIFTEPKIGIAYPNNTAAMRLYVLAAIIGPHSARCNYV
jgi:hypothetical protein